MHRYLRCGALILLRVFMVVEFALETEI